MNKKEVEKICVEVREAEIMRKYFAFHVEKYYRWAKEERKRGSLITMKYYLKRMKSNYIEFLKRDTTYVELHYIQNCLLNIGIADAYNSCKNSAKLKYLENGFSTESGYKINYKLMSMVENIMKGGK